MSYLAATQADAVNPAREAEPGKIIHETRQGEMAATGEVPFDCYYGSVDATPERARRVADTLLSRSSFSGWGIRTVDNREQHYNPMSYHNGSIWPHDNAMLALGLSRYGCREHARTLLSGLFEAAWLTELYRLPELFCGFARERSSQGPVPCPLACAPQAWASAAVFGLLAACLNITFDPSNRQVRLHRPLPPSFLQRLQIHNLKLGKETVTVDCKHRNDESDGKTTAVVRLQTGVNPD